MKNIFKKVLGLLLAIAMFLTICSCGISEGAYKGELFDLYSDEGEALFRIIRSREASSDETLLGAKLRTKINENLGLEVEYKPDTMKQAEGIYDLSIGVTNRPEAKKLYDKIKKNRKNCDLDYIIAVKNGVIYLVGGSIDGLTLAVEKFIADCCTTMDAYLSTEYYYFYEAGGSEPFIINGEKDLTKFVIVRPRYNVSYLTTMETDKLIKAVKQLTGEELKVVLDTEKEAEYEIIIGNANRDGVKKIEDRDTYTIYTKGKKVYLNGGHLYSTAMAVTEFVSLVKNGGEIKEGKDITGSYSNTLEGYDKSQYYTATLLDDFDGDTLNEKYWEPRTDQGMQGGYYTGKCELLPKNTSVKNGNCVMEATKDGDNYYVGGGITSQKRAWFLYGFYEISAILPDTNGFYSSFWVNGSNSDVPAPEFDIFEKFANNKQEIKQTFLKNPGGSQPPLDDGYTTTYYALDEGERWSSDYHTIGFLWTEDYVIFTVDGFINWKSTYSRNSHDVCGHKYCYVQLGLPVNLQHAVPGMNVMNGVQPVDETTDWNNNKYIVDYLLVFQRQGEGGSKFR